MFLFGAKGASKTNVTVQGELWNINFEGANDADEMDDLDDPNDMETVDAALVSA